MKLPLKKIHTVHAEDEYIFINPGRARIKVRTKDEDPYVDTSGEIWRWSDSGTRYLLNWKKILLPNSLKEIAKAYIFHRLESRSARTALRDASIFKIMSKKGLALDFPWTVISALKVLAVIEKQSSSALGISFRVFYCWCLTSGKPGFLRDAYFSLEETKLAKKNPYQSLFLHQEYVTQEQEILVLRRINESYDSDDWQLLRNNVLLHICFELAPRPSQLFTLNAEDLEYFETPNENIPGGKNQFFSLCLPMAKKRGVGMPERRARRISTELGKKITRLIQLNNIIFDNDVNPIFLEKSSKRLPAVTISRQILNALELAGLSNGAGATLLRHHLGQGLADQGAPADVIAEALGHNSTVAARAYIAATPTIAKIKARALGKNGTYKSIMTMMLTGQVADRKKIEKERWIKGVVHHQYLDGIGGCDLPKQSPCPKNPIYSCYTCRDFHPFADGPHGEVRSALEAQAQSFIDAAVDSMELDRSRVPVQLEQTLEAVDAVIARCNET